MLPEQQTGDGSLENPYQMPYRVYSYEVEAFVKEVYAFEEEHPEYSLNNYISILLEDDTEVVVR